MHYHTNIYNGDIVAGSLLIQETRKIASLLLNNVTDKEWKRAIEIDNILQKRSPASAIRQARLIKNGWSSVQDRSQAILRTSGKLN